MVASGSSLPDIRGLSFDDRLVLIERLWDSLIADGRSIPLTPSQAAELDRRLEKYKSDSNAGMTWDELRNQLQGGR